MNRLTNMRVYLCGAIDRCPFMGVQWRDYITPKLEKYNMTVFNPLTKPIEIGAEDCDSQRLKKKYKEQGKWDDLSAMMKVIRSVDLRLVDISDVLIVNLDLEIHPCGTYEEIFLANRQKKPIIVRVEQGKDNTPDWLFGTIPHQMIFSKWDEVEEYLSYINSSDEIEDHKRWYFFNVKENM